MFRPARHVGQCALAFGVLALASPAWGQEPGPPPAPADEGATETGRADEAKPPPLPPIYVLPAGPLDPGSILERLARPDLVILDGETFDRLRRPAEGAGGPGPGPGPVVESIRLEGKVHDDLAEIGMEADVTLSGKGPDWVPIRLDGQTLIGAHEGDHVLALRVGDGGGWEVEMRGQGRHRVRVDLLTLIRSEGAGRSLDLAIPTAAATAVALEVAAPIAEAEAGPKDPAAVETAADGRARLVAHLSPRPRLTLRWRAAADPSGSGPPVLEARGEIGIDVDRGTFRTRSSWAVTCARGVARTLVLRLDPADEVQGVEVDGAPVAIEGRRDAEGLLTIPLAEPLRAGETRRLTLSTRRALPAGSPTRFAVEGFPLVGASAQVGVIGIVQGGDLWVSGDEGRGLRQIDPGQDLPASLRARPGTVLAYEFVEQPFDLGIRVDPSPPSVGVEARTTVAVEAGSATVDARLDYRFTRGRIFEVRIGLPEGLEPEAVGPEEWVSASEVLAEPRPGGEPTGRTLVVRLTPRAREEKAFTVLLTGRQRIDPTASAVDIGLFRPREASWRGGTVAVLAARNVSVDLDESASAFAARDEPPTGWTWPADRRLSAAAPTLWLRQDGDAEALPLRVAVRPLSIHRATTLTAQVDRRRVDLRQETTCQVRNGGLARIDVAVPPLLEGRWEVEGDEVADRERLGVAPDGSVRYRLSLAREVGDALRLRFRARLPLETGLAADTATRLDLPWVRLLEGSASPARVRVAAEPGIRLAPDGPGWASPAGDDLASPRDGGPPARLEWVGPETGAGPPPILASALPPERLPPLVASRLWLRTVRAPDGTVHADAWYRVEVHQTSLAVALPRGAEWVRAQVGTDPVDEVERLPRGGGYRLRLPTDAAGPLLVGLEYTLPAPVAARGWGAPRLLDGGLVQRTLWEVRVPWSHSLVGIPSGWTDRNRWGWDRYVLRRHPWADEAALMAWVGGPTVRGRVPGESQGTTRHGDHGYLFGRSGGPEDLRPAVYPRATLVGLCSGTVLAVGVVLLVGRPPGRLVGLLALSAALAALAAVELSVILLGVQASAAGGALLAVAAITQRLVERRRPRGLVLGEPSGLGRPMPTGSVSRLEAMGVGSDASTIIRPRPGTTIEHAASPPGDATIERP